MKLKYKKMVIIATVVAMALGFVALVFLDNGSPTNNAEDAALDLNKNEDINKLIESYFTAKKTVNLEAMSELVSDESRIPKDEYTIKASYIEDYKDFDCYFIKNEEMDAYRVYVQYNMKLKNIESWVPCLTRYYIKVTSEGKYVIYLSALDDAEVDFIESADKNEEIQKLKEEVNKKLKEVLDQDANFKQFYQKMQKEIKAAANAAAVSNSPAASAPATPAVSATAAASAASTPTATVSPASATNAPAASAVPATASPVAQ